jgi:mono/diheme cytochrome c family protein
MTKWGTRAGAVALGLTLLAPQARSAEEAAAGKGTASKEMYLKYCGACHGPQGK